MKNHIIFLFVLVLVLVASCVIAPQGSYYKPSYPDKSAVFEGGWCYGTAGPPSVIKLPFEGGNVVKLRLESDDDKMIQLWLNIVVPPRSSVRFTDNKIKFTDPVSGDSWTREAPQLNLLSGPARSIPASTIINFEEIGPTTPLHVPTDVSWKNFQVWIPFSINNYYPRAATVYLPPIVANDKRYEVPAIELVEDAGAKEQNRIKAKGKQNYWWPYQAHEREDGSWASIEGFIIGGGVTGGYLDNEFGGNIMVSFPPATKWQFLTNSMRIVDLDTNIEHKVIFNSVKPNFNLKVKFTAPILAGGSIMGTKAYVNIPVSVKPHESITVELPTLIINGKEIRIKPITFKKTFGVGIIPFNC